MKIKSGEMKAQKSNLERWKRMERMWRNECGEMQLLMN